MTRRHSIFRPFLFALLLLALAARSAIPAGYMPGEAKASNGMTMVVCDGNMHGGHHHPPTDKTHDDAAQHVPCVFSAAFNLASDTGFVALPVHLVLPTYVTEAATVSFRHQLLTHHYLAQGPPPLLQS